MDQKFLDNFYKVSKKVDCLGKKVKWLPTKEFEDMVTKNKTNGIIYAWQVSKQTGEFLRFLALSNNSKNILELGTSIGYSGLWLGLAAKENNGHLYTFETFKPKIKLAKNHFKEAGLTKNISIIDKDIISELPKLKIKFDFVFIDAKKEDYHKYYSLVFPKLKLGGIIVADNVENHKKYMGKFLNIIKKDKKIVYYKLNIDNGLMLIKKIKKD